jgi:hypothetical protein
MSQRGFLGGIFNRGAGISWWQNGDFLVAKRGFLGGKPFCKLLRPSTVQAPKFLIYLIYFIKRYIWGCNGLRPPHIFFIFSFVRSVAVEVNNTAAARGVEDPLADPSANF